VVNFGQTDGDDDHFIKMRFSILMAGFVVPSYGGSFKLLGDE
jgi:hypothetical protein